MFAMNESRFINQEIATYFQVSNSEIRDEMKYGSDPETEFQKYIRATKSGEFI